MKKISLLPLLVFVVACKNEALKELDRVTIASVKPASVEADFCTLEADKVKSKLKFIFLVDKSNSNKNADPSIVGSVASDPSGDLRYTNIKSFVASNPNPATPTDDSISFAYIHFSTSATLRKGPTSGKSFMLKSEYQQVLESEHHPAGPTSSPVDTGGTDYLGALTNAHKLIDEDITAAKTQAALTGKVTSSFYVIFFITDGFPKVNGVAQDPTDIVSRILTVKALEDREKLYVDAVQINTGYYYQNAASRDQNAADLLQQMASTNVGGGNFIEFPNGSSIDFTQFAPPERNVRHILKDVLVTNQNLLWRNGRLERDSDGDGLIDTLELYYHSNLNAADSDGNGVNDGVEYYVLGRPCRDGNCSAGNSEAFPQCGGSAIPEGRARDIDNDKLNNCEELLLDSRHSAFDSNGDWIPDEMAWRHELSFLEGSQEIGLDSDNDRVLNYEEIKRFTPVRFDNRNIIDLPAYQYTLVKTSESSKQDCYHLSVTNVTTASATDSIRIYVLEAASVIEDRRFIRVAEKKFNGVGSSVYFSNADLK